MLRGDVALGCGLLVPGEGLHIVLWHAVTMRIEVPQVRLGLGVPLGRRLADALKRGRVALRRLLEEGRSPIRGRGQPPLCIAGRRARAGGQSRNARHKTEPGDCQRGFRASPRGLPAEADPMISKNTCCHHHPHPRAGGQCTEGALPAAPPIGHIAGRTPMRRAMWPVRPTMYGGQCGLLSTPARPLAPCAVLWEMRPIIFSFHALKITRRPRRVVDGCQPRMAGRMMTHRFPGSRWRAFTAKAQRACRRQGRSSAGGLAHHTGPSRRVWQRVHRTRTQRWLKWGGGCNCRSVAATRGHGVSHVPHILDRHQDWREARAVEIPVR